MAVWKRRLTALVAALGAVGMLMSSAEAREPRDRDGNTSSSFTFPPPPTMPPPTTSTTTPPPTMPPPTTSPSTTTPPPTMPPTTLSPDVEDQIADIIDTLEQFGDTFQEIIDFLSNPFAV